MQIANWFKILLMADKKYRRITEKINRPVMKKNSVKILCGAIVLIGILSGCYKLQKDYNYVKVTIDPHYNMTAKQYLFSRDTVLGGVVNSDTVLRLMRKGIEYAGIDWSEYEKPNRTYIFLHNN